MAHRDFFILYLLLALLLQRSMVLLFDIVLVPIKQFLDRIAAQQKETFLDSFFSFRCLVHIGIGKRRPDIWDERSW